MAAVPGSLFRRILFWAHLSCGVVAGAFILAMSVTGALLTYEHQFMDAAAARNHVEVPAGGTPLDADALAAKARVATQGKARLSLVFDADPTAPVTASRGREGSALLHPYTGEVLVDASAGRRAFFRVVENWHRWLGGDSRSVRATLIDYGNLLFLFLVISGVYVWLPQVWRWRTVRGLVLFQAKYVNGKMRDFNWHHVFSVWMLIPLLLISASGVVMSFDWANRLVFAAYGEEAPQRRGPPGGPAGGPTGGPAGAEARGPRPEVDSPAEQASLESLRAAAAGQVANWRRLTVPVGATGERVEIVAELQSAERRAPRQTVTLNARDASVLEVARPQGASMQSPGQRARSWFRLVHTGEQYGVIGQTLAGLASLAACFLVYTGLALAWRRLVRPLFRTATG
jgi:uncharacterized iron-regulated membrane protein